MDNGLLGDLLGLTARIESDLRTRVPADPAVENLRDEYKTARQAGLTSGTWAGWLDARLSQVATAWVLATVMIRFCEDNELLDIPFAVHPADLTGEDSYSARTHTTAGDVLVHAVDRLRAHPAMASVFDGSGHPFRQLRPSDEVGREVLSVWRRRNPDGTLRHDFTDASRSTEFLADLHSALNERARKSYGQTSTPRFVVDLIHDLVLEPALAEYAADRTSGTGGLSGFRVVDPACGSGAFLLDAYERLFRRWSDTRPDMSPWQRAARALRSVHGCDIDPGAVNVTRFRLLLAAMNSTGERRLDKVPDLSLVVATGDSLLYGRTTRPSRTTSPGLLRSEFDECQAHPSEVDEYAARHGFLLPASYHVVTTNPPYITVADKALSATYRDLYESCSGAYTLPVPFTELAFELARRGEAGGRVGLFTSNSFMKREFGRNLVEHTLARVEITHVIDTSGAYIPGHGTPTVILAGRNHVADPGTPVHTVVGRRSEPSAPAVPEQGHVWQSLRALAFMTGAVSEWAESYEQDRKQLSVFPWSLTPLAARDVLRRMETGERLGDRVVRIGYAANTGADDLFCATGGTFRRQGAEESATVPVLTGSEVRDWSASPALKAFFPRTPQRFDPVIDLHSLPGHHRRLWPYRTVLKERKGAKKSSPWYDWHHIASTGDAHPWSLVFPWVATHPHFSLLRGAAVPLNSAPVIKLPKSTSAESHLGLLGTLNSSAVSFWLKQMSQSKGQSRVDQLRGSEAGGDAWAKIYEFTSTRLLDLPLPAEFPVAEAAELDRLSAESQHVLREIAAPDTRVTADFLGSAKARSSSLRARMIALQEELDWEVYAHYNLISDAGELTGPVEDVPALAIGERAFEIVLARRAATGEVQTQWFTRHSATPLTDVPQHWPPAYRDLVRRRVDAIQRSTSLGLLEQPEYKRRWAVEPWEARIHAVLRQRLLDHCEAPHLWFEISPTGRQPVPRTVRQLTELLGGNEDFTRLAGLYAPAAGVSEVLLDLLTDEHVPQAAPLRYKASGLAKRRVWEETWEAQRREDRQEIADDVHHSTPAPPRFMAVDFMKPSYWRHRGKFDIPDERFVSLASSASPLSPLTPIGWAGWSADERALAVCRLLASDSHAHAQRPASAVPLLRAFADLLPWTAAVTRGTAPSPPLEGSESLRHAYEQHLTRLGLSAEDVDTWRPPAPKRGRPRRGA
ncbi:BREX-2 system adenine-specific DNA-methyltransferase PglX [Streptomyces sp. BH-SS-21]|uniref:site-specific DNA-methyltransferase (adenine-specific) n=1 Tax=Streptomyces liliiviolaceus TaxID=2823109 RepID=A0A941B4N9_9ACTN|nr:BREX-2 system adenine-specific DNA-methyltransferase PglX [Streptomyces liliiviolaceus]MBQ0847316.1 BREX-2 system adenine-specific DNA-methyltransferase PglX [Streptomyces liliiviolaceus]